MTRECENCGRGYNRRNMLEGWIRQNPGHLIGWTKKVIRICLHCQSASQTARVLRIVQINVIKGPQHRGRESA